MSNNQDKVILIVTAFLLLTLITGATILIVRLAGNSPREITINNITPPDYTYSVSIEGAVDNPGSYPATADDSLLSLINSAGLQDTADTDLISIHVTAINRNTEPQKVNINTAPAWLLEAIPGIGPGKAENIIAYREENGFFKGIDEIIKVDGIGQSLFNEIKDLITVGD